jgi:hypothetical protein
MRPRLKNPSNIPRGATLIANLFLCVGGIIFAISILILLLGLFLYVNRHESVPGTERLGLLWIASIILGVPGIVLSALTILPSFGLRRMRKWGLWCSYLTVIAWVSGYIGIRGNQFPLTTPFGLFIYFIALTVITVESYLTRIYWQYFTRAQ